AGNFIYELIIFWAIVGVIHAVEFFRRMRDRERHALALEVQREIAPEALGALVPQFFLQPLVENAIEHGIARRPGAGRIVIRAAIEEGRRLRVEVQDDGPGVVGDAIEEGVGLGASRQRLERLFGTEQRLTLESRLTGGTIASVVIPLRAA
ncbi:MAG: sensor histidine kinase, partial [Gemmatimonadaceae bacterium]